MKVLEEAAERLVRSSPEAPPLEAITARADALRRRRRFRQGALIAVSICAVVGVGALGTALVRDEGPPANVVASTPSGPTGDTITYRDDERNFQISYPRSWFRAEQSLTPTLGGDPDPWEVAAVATYDLGAAPPNENCDHQPEGALRAIGATDAFVWVYLPSWDPSEIPSRPDRITELPTGVDQYSDLVECLGGPVEFTSRGYRFSDHGRVLGLTVALGAEASPETRQQVLDVLNSIRLDSEPAATTTTATPTTAPATTTPPPTQPPAKIPGTTTTQLAGSYSGIENWELASGGDCFLDHHLDLTLVHDDGPRWQFHADYCGTMSGDQWTGTGPFTVLAGSDSSLTGQMRSSARLPTTGEPFDLEVTGGSGAFEGATGTCVLDNHVRAVRLGQQEQSGTFECAVVT